jgi:tetratricopeptide (TPR) repeat protein
LLLHRAQLLLDLGKEGQAEALLRLLAENEKALTRDEAQKVYDTLGRLARKRNDLEQIVSAYSQAFRFAPARADYLVWIGIAHRELGNLAAARASLRQSLDLVDSENCDSASWARAQYALTLEAIGDSGRALSTLWEALDAAEDSGTCSSERIDWLRKHVERLEAAGDP